MSKGNRDAKEASILTLLEGYRSSQVTDEFIEACCRAAEPYSVEAVARACQRFADGDVPGHNSAFLFHAAQLAEQCRFFDDMLSRQADAGEQLVSYPIGALPPPGTVPLGPLDADFGHGRINMRKLSPADKEFVMTNGRLPPQRIGTDRPQLALPSLKRMA